MSFRNGGGEDAVVVLGKLICDALVEGMTHLRASRATLMRSIFLRID